MKLQGESWDRIVGEFVRIGRTLFDAGLNNSHSGNMSIRVQDGIVISRHGAMLGDLGAGDLVVLGLDYTGEDIAFASIEFELHRAIYLSTPALAVIHTHPRSATVLSLKYDEILPVDMEGRYYFERVPVAAVGRASGSEELIQGLPSLLRGCPVVVVRGHGVFAIGENLEKCLQVSHSLEWSCDILLRCLNLGLQPEMLIDGDRQGDQ
jgi:L-fuculose-phosphate aldolase